MERQSAEAHRDYRQANEKFDYFLTTVTIAMCGYLVQTYDASGLKAFDAITLLGAGSIFLFLTSILCGFRRMEKLIKAKRKNYDYLRASERIGDISRSAASGETVLFDGKPADKNKILSEIEKCDERVESLTNEMNELGDSAEWLYKGLGWQDSNLRMAIPKTAALPLGYTPAYGERYRGLNGAATRTRTADLMITNQLLYQLSYCGGCCKKQDIFSFLIHEGFRIWLIKTVIQVMKAQLAGRF